MATTARPRTICQSCHGSGKVPMSASLFKVYEYILKHPRSTAKTVAEKLKRINPNGVNYFSNKISILFATGYITREKGEKGGQFMYSVNACQETE